jgi:heterodisulfide reductase subunit C
MCGSGRNIDIGHVNGHEEDNSSANRCFQCRSCNVRCANTLRAAGLGRLTRQFNPAEGARSMGQWLAAVTSMKGESNAMAVPAAVEMIRATPPERRSEFARDIWERRRARYGPTGRSDSVPF